MEKNRFELEGNWQLEVKFVGVLFEYGYKKRIINMKSTIEVLYSA